MDIAPDATANRDEAPISICAVRAEMGLPSAHARMPHALTPITASSGNSRRRARRQAALMEVASLQHLGDSFSRDWLKRGAQAAPPLFADADLGYSFGSSMSSFIDMDPAELFSMRWTTTAPPQPESDFEFGLPGGGGSSDQPSPVLVSASQIIRDGRLLPCEPVSRRSSGAQAQQHHGDRVTDLPNAPRSSPSSPLYHSAQSTPASLSSCSSGRNASARPPRRSSWKILVQYLRFLMPLLYRKVRALRRFSAPRRPRVAPASPARASMEWCHGNADTAVRDAILYCKKSSGQ